MAYTTIDDPSAHFQTAIWNGTGSALSVVFDGNSDLQPDMVWVKNRTLASDHRLTDSVRGTSAHSVPNGTDAEDSSSTALTAFNSDGFSVGNEQSYSRNTDTHVGWGWKESAAAGFDIVSFTTSGDDENFFHSLGVIPELIVLKPRASSGNWIVCGNFSGTTFGNKYMTLNTTDASQSDGSYSNPTSSQFSTSNNISPDSTHMAYLFRSVQGFSKIGFYKGNGQASNGPFVYLGFRPAFVLTKQIDGADDWRIFDNKRSSSGSNPVDKHIYPYSNGAEASSSTSSVPDGFDFLSNGFKVRQASGGINANNKSFLYMAFAESPIVNSNGIPNNAR